MNVLEAADELICQHQHRLEGEFSTAIAEEVFESDKRFSIEVAGFYIRSATEENS
jgi:hypothetical protein